MSVYSASFVRASPDHASTFLELSRLLREANANWIAESPSNLAMELVVRTSAGSDWISIQRSIAPPLLETISRVLQTTAIAIHVMDEMVLRFSYRRFEQGRAVRALNYADDGDLKGRGEWSTVEGEPEPWEAMLFSAERIATYRKRAPDEVQEACADGAIKSGFSVPTVCDGDTLAEIVRAFELPWEPTQNGFPPATRMEVIPGSPERLEALLRERRRPWWRYFLRRGQQK